MPRTCSVCTHLALNDINQALVIGQPYRAVAQRFAASPDAMFRHRSDHLPVHMVKAQDAVAVSNADSLLDQVKLLQRRAMAILDTAEAAGELRTALAAIREVRECIALLGELAGELDKRTTVNVTNNNFEGEWPALRWRIVSALDSYPDARQSVMSALASANGEHNGYAH